MLLVETYINISPGIGIGLFAKVKIAKETKYWIRNELFDKVISQVQLQSLEKIASDYFMKYGFFEKSGNWYLCGDHARFSNHSKSPNTRNHFNENGLLQYCTTSKIINANEEILIDYTEICLTCRDGVNFSDILMSL